VIILLKRKALKKISITSLTICLLLAIYLIPSNDINKIEKEITVEYSDNLEKENIYLLNDGYMLVRTSIVLVDNNDLAIKIQKLMNSLINTSNEILPNGLNRVLPKNTKVLAVNVNDGVATVDFSSDLLCVDGKLKEKKIEAISYTILDLDEIEGVTILVEGQLIDKVPEVITKEYGINKTYNIYSIQDIQKVVVYYIDEIEQQNYYVPVTNYVDDDRDKIKIIIENLSSSYIYEPNLISFLNQNTELINYEIDSDTMILNFNNSIFMNDKILEEVVYSISYSVFDNYDVEEVVFMVDNQEIVKKSLKDIETYE